MISNYVSLLLLCGLALGDYDTTTTTDTTITPTITVTTTVGYMEKIYETAYIYTDDTGHLTTTTEIGSTILTVEIPGQTVGVESSSSDGTVTVTDTVSSAVSDAVTITTSSFVSDSASVTSVEALVSDPASSAVITSDDLSVSETIPSSTASPVVSSVVSSAVSSVVSSNAESSSVISSSVEPISAVASESDIVASTSAVTPAESSAIPSGDYSTGHSTTTTVIDGKSMVVEYVILYTGDCCI
ncbi:hypothetical protein CLIB1444_10S03928 [[Candida] jaroonii]|uniref:Uncharacterized protein n=1 Tax=[Candida] jaroonii TaxID=467808 RepID=A0ACA9YDM3_9ASCO|nr:hypothetical protein CLIB1444_10S03928 [[Candida] jaroonii]